MVEAETSLFPLQLLARVQKIERVLGRVRTVPKGPRIIDIDILLYGTAVMHGAKLEDPHPRMAERRFVLAPLHDLAPDLRHPVTRDGCRRVAPRRAARRGAVDTLVVADVPDLQQALKKYWGYDSFRPMQERIIQSLMEGHYAAVVMPTGGGKSLCYQLPALVLGRTVLVVSPLIALMHDQVAQLADMGIPAAMLNSTMAGEEQAAMRAATQGAFRLLYLSPERLAREYTVILARKGSAGVVRHR